jgi:hypothetical protein
LDIRVSGHPDNSVNIKGDEVNGDIDNVSTMERTIDDNVSTIERTNKCDSGILSHNTIESLLKNEWLKSVLKSKRLRDDIMNIDSSQNRQATLKKIRLQKPDFEKFLNSLLVDVIEPSL